MKRNRWMATAAVSVSVCAIGLAGCGGSTDADGATGGAPTTTPTTASTAEEQPAGTDSGSGAVAGQYVTYDEFDQSAADFDATDVVLFFHAGWCPKCQETEDNLTASGVPDGLTVVKVDYDSATDLRQRYGVTLQHTFVQVDADGNEVAKWNGSFTGDAIAAETV